MRNTDSILAEASPAGRSVGKQPKGAPVAANPPGGSVSGRPSSQRPKRQARLGLRLAAVALMALSGIGAWFAYTQADARQEVVQVAQNVARGETIEASDLRPVTTGSVQGVSTVPGEEISSLVGQHASVDLVEGALLPSGAITPELTPAADSTLLGLRLDAGRIVAGEIRSRTPLRLVVTDPEGGQPGKTYELTGQEYTATLIHAEQAVDGSATLINVEIAQTDAAEIAQLAAAKRISVLQDPEE